MAISPLAGKPAPKDMLVDLARLERAYYESRARPGRPESARELRHQRPPRLVAARLVQRGAHPGDHAGDLRVPARAGDRRTALPRQGHARAVRARRSARALEVLAANGVETVIQQRRRRHADARHLARDPRPQPRPQRTHLADGIVITPSHNPPEDGGFKYNPPNGGPADTDVTRWIEDRANELLRERQRGREAHAATSGARARPRPTQQDFVAPYVEDLRQRRRHGRDPRRRPRARRRSARRRRRPLLGADQRDLRRSTSTVVNPAVDPTFSFMTVDHDGKIRMDCSSPYAMARLVALKDHYDVAFAQRPRRRPPRHRHAVRRADEPEPLPGGRDPLPAHAPARAGPRARRSARRWSAAA